MVEGQGESYNVVSVRPSGFQMDRQDPCGTAATVLKGNGRF